MPKTSVGIYISPRYVDIVELGGSKSYPVLLGFERQEIPPESSASAEGSVEERGLQQDRIAVAIKEALDRLKLKPQSVQTALSSNDVMIRYFDMPVLPKSEQAQAVKFEAKKYVPFKLDEITSDFKVLVSAKDKKSMGIFFIAATKDRLNSHISRFSAVGLKPAGIDIIPFALLRVLVLNKKADAKDAIAIVYVDNDKENVSVHIMESGMPFMSRDLKVLTDDKDTLFERIASEIRVSIDYYRRQKTKNDISKIVFCGEMLYSGLDAYVADELKIITDTLYDFDRVKNTDKASPSSIIAIGTALNGLGRSSYSVNLSPMAVVIQKRRVLDIMLLESVVAIAIIVVTYAFLNLSTRGITKELRRVEARSASLSKSTSLLDAGMLIDKKQQAIQGLELLQLVYQDRVLLANKLAATARYITDRQKDSGGIWLERLGFKESFLRGNSRYPSEIAREITLTGSSFSPDANNETDYINRFFESLKADKDFMNKLKEIELGSIERNNIEGHWVANFTVSAYSHRISDPARDRGRR
jgi:Tfp pilus assembly PilM family ATPase